MDVEIIYFSRDRSIYTRVSHVEGFEPRILKGLQKIYRETADLPDTVRPVVASRRARQLGLLVVRGWFTIDTPDNFLEQKMGHDWNTYQGMKVDLSGDRFRGEIRSFPPAGIWIIEKSAPFSGRYLHPENLAFPVKDLDGRISLL